MSVRPKQDRTLSEISHLFLSSVREKQTAGAPRPQRRPPSSKRDATIDVTPDEFARALTNDALQASSHGSTPIELRVSAVISSHLGDRPAERAREYAAHLCASGRQRVGLIEIDSSDLRVTLLEAPGSSPAAPRDPKPADTSQIDARGISQALEELRGDVDQWLLLMASPRGPEARAILPMLDRLVVLCTCDDEGVVACYRSLKGLGEADHHPPLSLALLDTTDSEQADQVFQKIDSVCRQFMKVSLEREAPVKPLPTRSVSEELVLNCRAGAADEQSSAAWLAVTHFLAQDRKANSMQPRKQIPETEVERKLLADIVLDGQAPSRHPTHAAPARDEQPAAEAALPIVNGPLPNASIQESEFGELRRAEIDNRKSVPDDVIDLPSADTGAPSIISAILRQHAGRLVECPVKPPMCPDASLTVASDRRLVLLAVARVGLGDLRAIGQAYRWLMQNRALVAMALPQFSIDAHALPRLELIVDQADLSAEILQPMLQSGCVSVQAYRKLRWAGRTGLLLEAA